MRLIPSHPLALHDSAWDSRSTWVSCMMHPNSKAHQTLVVAVLLQSPGLWETRGSRCDSRYCDVQIDRYIHRCLRLHWLFPHLYSCCRLDHLRSPFCDNQVRTAACMNVVPDPHSLLHQPSSKKDTASDSSRVDFAMFGRCVDASEISSRQGAHRRCLTRQLFRHGPGYAKQKIYFFKN